MRKIEFEGWITRDLKGDNGIVLAEVWLTEPEWRNGWWERENASTWTLPTTCGLRLGEKRKVKITFEEVG